MVQRLESKIELIQLLQITLVYSTVALATWGFCVIVYCLEGLFVCLFVLTMSSQKYFIQVIPDIKFSAQITTVEWEMFWDRQHAPENLSGPFVYEIHGILFG